MKPHHIVAFLLGCAVSIAAPLNLLWNPNAAADKVTEYRVYKLEGTTRTLLARTSAARATLEVNGGETVVVTAFNGIESPPSAPVVLPKRPGAPEGLRIEITITLPTP
jgi:hypothetical protein